MNGSLRGAISMNHPRIQMLLAAVVAFFAIAALAVTVLIGQQQASMQDSFRYEISWSANQAGTEMARLGQAIGEYALDPDAASVAMVQTRYDILVGRSREFSQGRFKQSAEVAELGPKVQRFAEDVARLELPVSRLRTDPRAAQEILDIVDEAMPNLARLSSGSNLISTREATNTRSELRIQHLVLSSITFGLIFSGVLLMAMLRKQYNVIRGTNREISIRNERFNAALDNMGQGLCMFDAEGRLIVSNVRFSDMLGMGQSEVPRGSTADDLASKGMSDVAVALHPRFKSGEITTMFNHATNDGRIISVSQRLMESGGWVSTFEDVTERFRHEEQVAYMATHDDLTGLANRTRFHEEMEMALRQARHTGLSTALLCLDLDRFKTINDTLGHHIGDLLLKEIALRLTGTLRAGDTLARLGGDEFAVIQVDVKNQEDVSILADRIMAAMKEPYDLDDHRMIVETSIGIAMAPDDHDDVEGLLKAADVALYRSKSEGRGSYRFFEIGMDQHIQDRRVYEMDLRTAMQEKQFHLVFQPIVDLFDPSRVMTYETLLRWNHPERGPVSPAEFIPIAEEIGLIVPLGAWVLREACRQAASWAGEPRIAVNLSPVQIKRDNVHALVVSVLAETGFAAERLELEITESILMEESSSMSSALKRVRELGVRISMDDFGTGYSSLSYLTKFDFDKIKIDRSFIAEVDEPQNREIIGMICSIGSRRGIDVVAEGIENAHQAEALLAMGCNQGQGYYFSRPLPAEQFPELTKQKQERVA